MQTSSTVVANSIMSDRKRKPSSTSRVVDKRAKCVNEQLVKIKKMSRKDLEEFVRQKIVEVITTSANFGELSRKFERMSEAYEKIKAKAVTLQKQLEDLKKVTKSIKVTEETKAFRIPKITRSVGLQVTSKVSSDFEKTKTSGSKQETHVIPIREGTGTREIAEASNIHVNSMRNDIAGVSEYLKTNEVIKSTRCSIPFSGQREGGSEVEQFNDKHVYYKESESEALSLSVKKSETTDVIVITWTNKLNNFDAATVMHYELEGAKGEKMKWSRIGNTIKPLPLPMVCTLNKFKMGVLYHFRVKMITKDIISFSNVSSISL